METRENMQDNYRQPQTEGGDQQTIIIDPALHQQAPPIDPEDEETDEDTEDDEQFPSREDLEDEDYDLNHDADDDESLNIDDDDEF